MKILSIVAVLLIFLSAIYLLISTRAKNGSVEMGIGSLLFTISVLGNSAIYYYQISHRYEFEKSQEILYSISDFFISYFTPLGLFIFAIGFARYSKLLVFIWNKRGMRN